VNIIDTVIRKCAFLIRKTLFLLIEILLYYKMKPKDMEMFFFAWILISLLFIIFTTVNVELDYPLLSKNTGDITRNIDVSIDKLKKESQSLLQIKLLNSTNLTFLFYMFINIIGYITVM
jgi:hypothetical protein